MQETFFKVMFWIFFTLFILSWLIFSYSIKENYNLAERCFFCYVIFGYGIVAFGIPLCDCSKKRGEVDDT